MVRVAAYQTLPAKTFRQRCEQLNTVLAKADELTIDFLCLPEGFLTGYYNEREQAQANSLHKTDVLFQQLLRDISKYRVTVIIGFNECYGDQLFDSAAIIEQGILLGVQRKHYRYHEFCHAGNEFTVFVSKGISFGVVICLDANYFEPSRLCALQGATVLFVPACNRVPLHHRFAQRPLYYSHFIARAHENRCWLVVADWIWPQDGLEVCPGHTVIYDPDGHEIVRSKEGVEDMIIVDIPQEKLLSDKGKRVHGSEALWQKLIHSYRGQRS